MTRMEENTLLFTKQLFVNNNNLFKKPCFKHFYIEHTSLLPK